MKKTIKLIIFSVCFLFLSFNSTTIFASTTDGTIDSTFRYAWGENIGFVDFGSTAGNVHVTDSTLSGSMYGENIGWVDLSTITNNGEGALSGYAWGENVGWIDFSYVAIGSDGVFSGGAYGENIGWITFGTGDNKVATDWRPVLSRGGVTITSSSESHKSSSHSTFPFLNTVCKQGDLFSSATGSPCTQIIITPPPSQPTCSIFSTLFFGSRGLEVTCLQTKLHISSDGIFGPKTKAAVILFQKANSLTPDGIVGPITRSKLIIIDN